MGNRLSKIYTRTGDAGTTGLGNGNRVSKNSLRIHSLGEVDELNAVIGLLLTEDLPDEIRALLTDVQNDLFDLGGEVCIPGMSMISERQVTRLENELDRMNEHLEPLKDFILPGGTRAAALAHMARTVCRRAERMLVGLAQEEAVNDGPRQYLNRLSDLLFVLGRALNRAGGRGDVLWQKGKNA
ncbi:cob(I)yrinic acid a,c-diamide adenosyltransferase [Pseudothauera lacus]|uniref:Cobalamin adenosyltransferase n=1 Tax=Pseudothauera lacus TaxID=2136175 RepID=A0A2T4IEF7_9RHOO|nr:cob(I)yrinic acid a,c-diamide adenosyltransferase [Pseudothauera lacus]PTD96155.1 cob(I)yrinic acid a,c-diamide adenosyltransferase [Pseudothauera lacus]